MTGRRAAVALLLFAVAGLIVSSSAVATAQVGVITGNDTTMRMPDPFVLLFLGLCGTLGTAAGWLAYHPGRRRPPQ